MTHQAAMYVVLVCVNVLLINAVVFLLDVIGILPQISKLGGMAVVAAWNYFIYSRVIFKKHA